MLKTISLMILAVIGLSGAAFAQKPKPTPKPSKTPPPKVSPAKAAAAKCDANNLTAAEITELLSAQNKARSDQKLPPFTWDCNLAKYAQEWATRGIAEHRADTPYGENVFVASDPAENISTVVKTWMNEKSNWNNKTATCAVGKVCNHYTQIMWNRTSQVGCGINRNATGKWKVLLVCNYDPAGNSGGPAY